MAGVRGRRLYILLIVALLAGWLALLAPRALPAGDLARTALLLVRVAVLLLLPGLAVLLLLRPLEGADLLSTLCLAPLLSVALYPLHLFWGGLAGLRWGPWAVRGLLLAAALVIAWRARGLWAQGAWRPTRAALWAALALGGVLTLALAVRLAQIRGVPYPSWVDSYHHTLITQLILDGGRVPESYLPYAPMEGFHYHFGFHAGSAFVAWATGLSAHRAVLWGGQVLNALSVPAAFVLLDRLTRDQRAALLAALLVGLVSRMPAFYLNWGRYPQLAGQVVLPAAVVLTVEALRRREGWWRPALVGALLVGGIGLTHYVVSIFYLASALVVALLALARRPAAGSRVGRLGRLAALGTLALVLVAPWLPALLAKTLSSAQAVAARGVEGQYDYVTLPFVLDKGLRAPELIVAALSALWVLGRARTRPLGAALLLWLGILFFLANPSVSGLPSGFMPNGAVILGLYLPASALVGLAASDVVGLVGRRLSGRGARRALAAGGLVGLALLAFLGARDMLTAGVEPWWRLNANSDLEAYAWIAAHTPPDARFFVAGTIAETEGFVGVDGGLWLPYAAHRATTLPPMIYVNEMGVEEIRATNDLNWRLSLAGSAEELARRAREAGVTHLYVGWRIPQAWHRYVDDPAFFTCVYDARWVRIYEVR